MCVLSFIKLIYIYIYIYIYIIVLMYINFKKFSCLNAAVISVKKLSHIIFFKLNELVYI